MTAQPGREIRLTEIARSQRFHLGNALGIVSLQQPAIQIEKQFHYNESSPLVSIKKRMVARNPEGIRGRERCCIPILAVCFEIARTGQSRSEQSRIAYPRYAAVLGQLRFVNGERNASPDPSPAHLYYLANARSTLRRFFMMRSAAFICFSKAGS
jgi:hypothetical protein